MYKSTFLSLQPSLNEKGASAHRGIFFFAFLLQKEKLWLPLQPASFGRGLRKRKTKKWQENKFTFFLDFTKRIGTFATPNETTLGILLNKTTVLGGHTVLPTGRAHVLWMDGNDKLVSVLASQEISTGHVYSRNQVLAQTSWISPRHGLCLGRD